MKILGKEIEQKDIATGLLTIIMLAGAISIYQTKEDTIKGCREIQIKTLDENCDACIQWFKYNMQKTIITSKNDYNLFGSENNGK